MRIEDEVAVVTGGAVGMGRATAERLASRGALVVVADTAEASWERSRVRFPKVDMTDDAAASELMACQPRILVKAGSEPVPRLCFPEASVAARESSW